MKLKLHIGGRSFQSIRICFFKSKFLFRYLCCTANIPFVFIVQWKKMNHGKHHARVSACFASERGVYGGLGFTLLYVTCLQEAFAFVIMACELYACIFGFG
jgi:hypothetical protein